MRLVLKKIVFENSEGQDAVFGSHYFSLHNKINPILIIQTFQSAVSLD